MHLVHINKAPQYLTDVIATVAQSSVRHGLCSADTSIYVKPRTRTKFGDCGFYFAGPDAWNILLSHLHFITDAAAFKRNLKSELLDKCSTTDS